MVKYRGDSRERKCSTCRFLYRWGGGRLVPWCKGPEEYRTGPYPYDGGCIMHEFISPWMERISDAPASAYGKCPVVTCDNKSGDGCLASPHIYRHCEKRQAVSKPLRGLED